jgi:hypothetical protein
MKVDCAERGKMRRLTAHQNSGAPNRHSMPCCWQITAFRSAKLLRSLARNESKKIFGPDDAIDRSRRGEVNNAGEDENDPKDH